MWPAVAQEVKVTIGSTSYVLRQEDTRQLTNTGSDKTVIVISIIL